MNLFNNLSVRTAWTLLVGTFSLLVIGVGALGFYASHSGRDAFDALNEIHVEQSQALNQAYIDLLRARIEMDRAAELLRSPSFDRPGPVIERAEELMSQSRHAFNRFLDIPSLPEQVEVAGSLTERYNSLLDTGMTLQLMMLKEQDDAGYRSGQSRITDMSQALIAGVDDFVSASAREGERLVSHAEQLDTWLRVAIGLAVTLSLVIALLSLWAMRRHVMRPLGKIIDHFRAITAGDLTQPVEPRGRNEVGQLFLELERMRVSLAEMATQLDGSSQHVLASAQRMNTGNHDLAERTQEQSATLERTAAALTEMTAAVAHNADGAERGKAVAQNATEKAREGSRVIQDFIDTMGDIHQRSTQIDDIIGLIDSLAFQTSILALNASVEAARAGDQGKGFAVVANEVRNLASRSAEAAHQIRGLVDDSRSSIDRGNALTSRAASGMQTIVVAIDEVDALMAQIAEASGEQHRAIAQLSAAMNQMDAVTQDNIHLVEVASDDARALEEQASRMREQAARFTTSKASMIGLPGVWQPRVIEEKEPGRVNRGHYSIMSDEQE